MEEKLVTLAILTYSKAQILKNVLDNEGIENYIHNVNLIQPIISSGVRVRIQESDLPRALKIIESSAWLADSIISEKPMEVGEGICPKILIPVDFSNYSVKACNFGFNLAEKFDAEVILLHVYFTPIYNSTLPYSDVFNYQIQDEELATTIIKKVHGDLDHLSNSIKEKIKAGILPKVKYSCILREGIPEDEIINYAKEFTPLLIVMGTRGAGQKEIDLLGSVTAEVIDRSRTTVLAIPEDTPFENFDAVKKIAFITNFDQRDLVAFDNFFNTWNVYEYDVSLLLMATEKESKDLMNSIKMSGLRDYFEKHYPSFHFSFNVVYSDDNLRSFDKYIADNHIDVITTVSYRRNVFARLFNPSIARKMIFHTDTPLLIIHQQ